MLSDADDDGSSDERPWIQLDEVDFDQIEERLDAAIQDFSADVFIPNLRYKLTIMSRVVAELS